MKRKPMHLTLPQEAWIEQQADKLGISSAEFIRRIIDHFRFGGSPFPHAPPREEETEGEIRS